MDYAVQCMPAGRILHAAGTGIFAKYYATCTRISISYSILYTVARISGDRDSCEGVHPRCSTQFATAIIYTEDATIDKVVLSVFSVGEIWRYVRTLG